MPLYEYKCDQCKLIFAELRKISEREDPIECPHCGASASIMFSTFSRGGGSASVDGCPVAGDCSQGFT
jgi:putative FmdB family regulatory protein